MRLTRDQVDRARRRWSEGGAEGIVVEREVLGVVPQRGHRVAVVVIERQIVGARQQIEVVHQPAVDGFLLVGIVMVVAAGDEVADDTVEPLGIGDVGVVGQQSSGEAIDRRGVLLGDKFGFALRVRRVRVAK